MRIGLHTFGDPVMGMGHVYRCLALSQALQARFPDADIVLLMDDGAEGKALARDAFPGEVLGLRLGETPAPACDVLVVDRLQMPPPAMSALRDGAAFVVSLDDVGPGRWLADLAVGALYLPQCPQPPESRTVAADGLAMLAIGAAFAATPYAVRETVSDLLLTQGGSDTYGLVPELARALAPWLTAHPGVTLHVHTGPAFRHDAALEAALAPLPRVERHRRVPDLAALYAGMDMAVAAAGVMTCEMAAVGVPLIVVTGEEKELETAAMLEQAQAARVVGRWDGGAGAAVAMEVAALAGDAAARRALSDAARRAVDGRGLERLIDLIAKGMER